MASPNPSLSPRVRAIAHITGPEGTVQREHDLQEHLAKVAARAADNAEPFGGAAWARLAGQWHDIGKYRPGFQRYIRQPKVADAHIEGKVPGSEKTHSAAGAIWAIEAFRASHGENGALAARVFAYLIASHHAGLYDWDGGLKERLVSEDSKTEFAEARALAPETILDCVGFNPDLRNIPGGPEGFSLWVRMLFSALVDADFLDTESFFDPKLTNSRSSFPAILALFPVFDAHIGELAAQAPATLVNKLRADVLQSCRQKAALTPGFFSLSVPTGGGKTLSSLAFALQHAKHHGKRRIIYAIPYTSIIEQTADIFKRIFASMGPEVLVEHHSQAESDERSETARSRLASENWDAPLIVTTNVQLFESLFAAKTSRCRKLHNIVGSVIVLDEAQQLPPDFLQPILDVLNLLVKQYGVTVLLCTATQPALSSTSFFDASSNLRGLENVREIVNDPDELYKRLQRVNVTLPLNWQTPMPWVEVASAVAQEDCILVIVNTRKAAKELLALLPKGTLHLSALMCGAHRSDVLEVIRSRLKAKREGRDLEPLRVVSTQLVEAGVDLDFPVVWRALAGLDSIAQAAGRCNREGLLANGGRVVVFVPPEALPNGLLRKAGDECVSTLFGATEYPLSLPLFEKFFRQFYRATDLDKKKINDLLKVEPTTLGVQFRTAAHAFRLIDDGDKASVVVRYSEKLEEIEMLLNTLKRDGPERSLMRKLQRYIVSINLRDAERLLGKGLGLAMPGLYVQEADGLYDPRR
ncbi:MAG: CRISPR-associated helicase Cas3', partial [Betaproteobacteria bacterium]